MRLFTALLAEITTTKERISREIHTAHAISAPTLHGQLQTYAYLTDVCLHVHVCVYVCGCEYVCDVYVCMYMYLCMHVYVCMYVPT